MNRLIKVCCSVVLLLGLAVPAIAAPPLCEEHCTCTTPCNYPCSPDVVGGATNCGRWGVCVGKCFATALPFEKPADASQPVCPALPAVPAPLPVS